MSKIKKKDPDQISTYERTMSVGEFLDPEWPIKVMDEARDHVALFVDMEDTPLTHWDEIRITLTIRRKHKDGGKNDVKRTTE